MTEDQGAKQLTFRSSRFGELTVSEEAIFVIKGGIIGFAKETRYVLLDYTPPFSWLHSIENPELAFVVVNASEFGPNYVTRLPAKDTELAIQSEEDMSALNIITFRPNPADTTVNLKAPVIVNVSTKIGRQVILDDQDLSTRVPLLAQK